MTNPTGQQGYGYPQPGPNPYGQQQPQNPYGQPQGPYAQPPNAYGQPQNPQAQPQNPYGQPQNPYGQPQPQNPYAQPQNPYGQQPGGPLGVNGQGASDDDGFRKRTGLTNVKIAGLVVLLLAAGGIALVKHNAAKSQPSGAAVGDCIHMDNSTAVSDRQAAKDAKKVSCTDASANYTVVGRVEDSDNNSKCAAAGGGWKDGDPFVSQGSFSTKTKSWVLCLEPK